MARRPREIGGGVCGKGEGVCMEARLLELGHRVSGGGERWIGPSGGRCERGERRWLWKVGRWF